MSDHKPEDEESKRLTFQQAASGASVSTAIGGGTLVVGYSQQTLKTAETSTAVSYAVSSTNGSSVTYTTTAATNGDLDADGDTTVMGATYSMALDADTTVKIGYQSAKDADSDSHTRMDASVSRSLGGGASVYLDIRSLNGDADTSGTDIAVGTSVSF